MLCHIVWATIATALLSCPPAQARDWFVRAGSNGDGSREKPFQDPHFALAEADPGDTIHVAKGIYHGNLNCGNWVIASPKLTMLGGYSDDFTQRDPWRKPSELRFSKDFKGKNEGKLIEGSGSHEDFTLDGFVLDPRERNDYESRTGSLVGGSDPIISLSDSGARIRNCAFVNGADGAIALDGGGCVIENNLIINTAGDAAIRLNARGAGTGVIKSNTFLFVWASRGIGSGGSIEGNAVSFWSSDSEYEVSDNIFVGCDNRAVDGGAAAKLSATNNVFWLNAAHNIKVHANEQTVFADDVNMSDLEDAGLKACGRNDVVNPELIGLDPGWLEKFLRRAKRDYPASKAPQIAEFRKAVGIAADDDKSGTIGFAMAYDATAALKIVPAKLKQGSHPVAIEVKPFTGGTPAPPKQYEKSTWQKLAETPKALDGKCIEIIGAIGRGTSASNFEAIPKDEFRAIEFHDIGEQLGATPVIFVKKGSKAERGLQELIAWDGNGTPSEKHMVRGLARYDPNVSARRKGTIVVDSISALVETPTVSQSKPRPVGRDWFVIAGAVGGDGSREKPFKDPWEPLDLAKEGDAIHVAEGEYFGKFKSGKWTISAPNLSMLGGYDKEFTERNPWKRPTRLGFTPGASGGGHDPYINGEGSHDGLIFDGFVLDGKDINRVDADGDLMGPGGDSLIEIGSADAIIRNCLLINSAAAATRASGDHTTLENNLIVNCQRYSINITYRHQHPFIIRNNTILFTWCDRPQRTGSDCGSAIASWNGTLFELDNNIIGYCDAQAVSASTPVKKLKVTNNVFFRNRFAHFSDHAQIIIDDNAMTLFKELGFAAGDGNVVLDPQMNFEKTWWQGYDGKDGQAFYARPYDWKAALNLVPQNPACKAGARPVKLEVHFNKK